MLVDLGGLLLQQNSGDPDGTLGADTTEYHQNRTNLDTYAGVRLHSNGIQYYASGGGAWTQTSHGQWVTTGLTSQFWVRATLNSGTLDFTNSGTGSFLQLNTTRSWGLVDLVPGVTTETASVTLELATDSGGSNIISTVTYTLQAFNDNGT